MYSVHCKQLYVNDLFKIFLGVLSKRIFFSLMKKKFKGHVMTFNNILNLNRHSKYVDDIKDFISELKMTFLREVLGAKCESSFPDLENTVWKVGIYRRIK